jgi:tetratricopeptide (TPR) repeat protein
MADAYRLQGKNTQAMKAFNDIIKAYPNFAPAYLGRARTRLAADASASAGTVAAAQADLETALVKDPEYGEAYLELSTLLINAKDFQTAGPLLDQAARVLPDSPLIFVYRAQVYMLAGAYEQALADAEHALALDKTSLPAYLMKGEALVKTGDLKGSLEALTVYTTYIKDDAQAWLWIGLAQDEAGESKEALQAYSEALRLNSRLYEALLYRARIYLAQKEGDSALNDYRAAQSLDAESFEVSMGIGKALLLLNYEGDAYMQFERTQGLAKENTQQAELFYWRALSLEALGNLDVALREWNKLLALPKGSATAEMLAAAKEHSLALVTATPTRPVTATRTATLSASRTPQQSATPKVSATPKPTRTP